jgi:hypothetical protein
MIPSSQASIWDLVHNVFLFKRNMTNIKMTGKIATKRATQDMMENPSDAKRRPLPRLETPAVMFTNVSTIPCTLPLSPGINMSLNKVDPVTKQQFQPRPTRNKMNASHATDELKGARMHDETRKRLPVIIIVVLPALSIRYPMKNEKPYIPRT